VAQPPEGMVLIPAGTFQMGSTTGDVDEVPVHTVELDAYYIDQYEVTNAEYQVFVAATGHPPPRGIGYTAVYELLKNDYEPWNDPGFNHPDQPVTTVTWFDATAYCKWVGKRLPTEAEWEKAARGGLEGARYPWGDTEPGNTSANFADSQTEFEWRSPDVNDGFLFTAPVGTFPPNGYGLFDMAGNVWEWCADWYSPTYYSDVQGAENPPRNPTGPDTGERRVLRGGTWYRAVHTIRNAERVSDFPSNSLNVVGFRCAMDAP
jgi:formylglycine-generating enzyme required for sulfatase activity